MDDEILDAPDWDDNPPRFCYACNWIDETCAAEVCRECGTKMTPRGYCDVCEDYINDVIGALCPKHEIELIRISPAERSRLNQPPGMGHEWVTIRTFANPLEAEPLRIRLAAEAIPTFLTNERVSQLSGFEVATGGVRLQVPAELVADARVLLNQTWAPVETGEPPESGDDALAELAPAIGSTRRKIIRISIWIILLGPILLALSTVLFSTIRR